MHKQSDVTAALATRLDPAVVARVWIQQTAWRNMRRIDGGSACAKLALIMSCAGPADLTPRRGLVYDAVLVSIFIVYSAKEECDVAGDALKVEDATWDAEVDFWAVWCGPCQMVAPIIEELGKEYAGKVKVRKLNTDENPEVAGRYQVMSIPTILFFKNGQVVEKLVGARPKRQFKEMIDSLLAQPAGSA